MNQQHLLGMTLSEIQKEISELDLPKFTAKQIADWVYVKRVTGIGGIFFKCQDPAKT